MNSIEDFAKKAVSAISMHRIVFTTRKELESSNLYTGHYRDGDPKIRDYRKSDSHGKTIDSLYEFVRDFVYIRKTEPERKIKPTMKQNLNHTRNLYILRHSK